MLLGIDKQGQWHVSDASNYLLNADDPAHIALRPSATSLAQVPGKHEHQLIDAQNGQPLPTVDVIFPIVHGTLGEDGSLQGMLRVANLPFVVLMFWLQQPVWIKMSPNVCYAMPG
ncbi:D-alanine--D-alanine ligase [Escherichia coli]|nr:D-alanine--D-alanine ligase [Escherichia coli]